MRQECLTVTARVAGIGWRSEDAVVLELQPQRPCQGCRGCFWREAREVRIPIAAAPDVAPGEAVTLSLPAAAVLRAALLVYGLPLSLLAFGTVAGWLAGGSDAASLAGAATGIVLAAACLRRARAAGEARLAAQLQVSRVT